MSGSNSGPNNNSTTVQDQASTSSVNQSQISVSSSTSPPSTCLPERPNEKSIPALITILTNRYEPPGLKRVHRLVFGKRFQRNDESVPDFLSAIQDLASKCDFGAQLDDQLLDRLISGISDQETRKKLLAASNLTYESAKTMVLQAEAVRKECHALAQAHALQVSLSPQNSECQTPSARPE